MFISETYGTSTVNTIRKPSKKKNVDDPTVELRYARRFKRFKIFFVAMKIFSRVISTPYSVYFTRGSF